MRERSRLQAELVTGRYHSVDSLGKQSTPTTNGLYPYYGSGTNQLFKDVVTPSFERRRSNGELIVNPMWSETRGYASHVLPFKYYWKYTPSKTVSPSGAWAEDLFSINASVAIRLEDGYRALPAFSTTDAGIAVAEAYANAATPDAMSLVFVGELGETLKLLRRPLDLLMDRTLPFEKLRKRLRREKRGIRSAEFLDELTSLWLTTRYGIMPLVYEIEGTLRALSRKAEVLRLTARGSHVVSGTLNHDYPPIGTTANQYILDQSYAGSWEISYRAGVIYDWDSDVADFFGANLHDLPEAALELTRLSFVANWFVNAQEYLRALTFTARAKQAAAWWTAKLDATIQTTINVRPGSGGSDGRYSWSLQMDLDPSGSTVLHTVRRKVREPATVADAALGFRYQMNTLRYVDAFSLLYQRLSPSASRDHLTTRKI